MPRPIRCILLVDDDPDDNFFHRLVIEQSGLCDEVRMAEKGLDALHYLTHTDQPGYQRPDIIFLDINMPGMNGFEFLEHYHRLPEDQKSRLLLLMLTTSLNPIDQKRAGAFSEVNGYHTKPLSLEMLQEIVDQYFR
jgi:CheY-like chemotaxis protein